MRRARSSAAPGGEEDHPADDRSRPRTTVPVGQAARRTRRSSGGVSLGAVTFNIATLALLMGIFAIVTGRALGPSDRGIVVIFMTLSSMLMVLGSFGTNTFARVHLVSTSARLALDEYLGLIGALAAAQLAISVILGGLAIWATNSLPNLAVLLLLVVCSVLNVVSYLLRDGLYAFGHNGRASRGDPIGAAIQLFLVLAIWAAAGLTLDRALLSIVAGQACCAGYLIIQFRRVHLPLAISFSFRSCLRQIRGGLPALITNLGQSFIFRIDRLLLGFLATTAAVGTYSVAVTMTETLLLIPISIGQAMFHRLASGRMQLAAMRRLRLISLTISTAGAAILGVVSPWVIDLLFGPDYHSAVAPLRILLVGAVAIGSYLVDVACINAVGRLGSAARLTLLGFIVVGVFDLVLIPAYAMNGAALASAFGYVVMAVAAAIRLHRVTAGGHPMQAVGSPSTPAAGPSPTLSG